MLFYYTREFGPEGCILTHEGRAAGADLAALLARGRPPLRAALELGAALADILSVSIEDQVVHGDIKPGFVKVDAVGAVSIEGWGAVRGTCRAPEAQPVGPATDVYNLGVVLHALLATEPLGALPRDPDAHDDAVVQKVTSMDFGDAEGKRWVQELRQFIALCMAFDPAERPEALDVANVLAHVADQCPEPGMQRWAARLVPQISGDSAPRAVPNPPPEEKLDGPTFSHGPLQTGMFKSQTRTAPAAKGESTAFWTKDKIDAMLATEDAEDEEELAPPRPQPRPTLRDEPLSEARLAPMARPVPVAPQPAPVAPQPAPAARPAPAPRPAPPAQVPPAQPFAIQGPVAQGPVVHGPVVRGPVPPPPPPPTRKGGLGKYIAIALVLLILGGGVLLAAAAGVWFRFFRGAPSDPAPDLPKAEEPAVPPPTRPPPEDTGRGKTKPAKPPAPAADGSSGGTRGSRTTPSTTTATSPSTTPRTTAGTGRTGTSSTASSSTASSSTASSGSSHGSSSGSPGPATPDPDELADGSKYSVRFVAQGHEASLTCGDGQQASFVSSTQLEFEGVVTCMVQIEGARGAVQVRKAQTVTCTTAGSQVSCGGG